MKLRIKPKSLSSYFFRKNMIVFIVLTIMVSSLVGGLIFFMCTNIVIVIKAQDSSFTTNFSAKIKLLKIICDTGSLVIYNSTSITPDSGYIPKNGQYTTLNDIILVYVFSYIGLTVMLFAALYYCLTNFIIPFAKRDVLIYATPSINKKNIVKAQIFSINIYQTLTILTLSLVVDFFAVTGIHSKDYLTRLLILEIGFLFVTLIGTNIICFAAIFLSNNPYLASLGAVIAFTVIIGLGFLDHYIEYYNMHNPKDSKQNYKLWKDRHDFYSFTYFFSIVGLLNNTFIFDSDKFTYSDQTLTIPSISKFNPDDGDITKGLVGIFSNGKYDSLNIIVALIKIALSLFILIVSYRVTISGYEFRAAKNIYSWNNKEIKIKKEKQTKIKEKMQKNKSDNNNGIIQNAN